MRKNRRHNIPMMLACVLFSLTLVTIHLTGGLYAKYTVSDSAEDSARVAVMGTGVEEISTGYLYVEPGKTGEDKAVYFDFILCNGKSTKPCEVDLDYTIEIKQIENNIPLTWELYRKTADEALLPVEKDNDKYIGNFEAGSYTETKYSLKVEWLVENYPAPELSFEVDALEIIITAQQVD